MATPSDCESAKRLVADIAGRNLYLDDKEKGQIAPGNPELRRKLEEGIFHLQVTAGFTAITYEILVPSRGIEHVSKPSS